MTPKLTISSASILRLLGSTSAFYPQEIGIIGSAAGGPVTLNGSIEFPQLGLAFGESMIFTPTGPITGVWDSGTGQVDLQVPVNAIDSDGDAAPLVLNLTTGVAYGRNQSGVVISAAGTPRMPDSQILKLVAIAQIPVGYHNGAEQRLVTLEVLASMTFGSSTNQPRPTVFGRRG